MTFVERLIGGVKIRTVKDYLRGVLPDSLVKFLLLISIVRTGGNYHRVITKVILGSGNGT